MEKIRVVQFLPYFPPHKGGLETHVQEWSENWVSFGYGEVLNIVSSVGQNGISGEYFDRGFRVLVIPTFDLVSGFPVPKFWLPDFWRAIGEIRRFHPMIIKTSTRFFLSSFIGGIIAKVFRIRWCHVEHGSDFVRLSSPITNLFARIYDHIFGRWIFFAADEVVGVSQACTRFIARFTSRKTHVIYRGLDTAIFPKKECWELRKRFPEKTILGFVGRLYAWKNVETLIRAYLSLEPVIRDTCQLVIVGWGEDLDRLQKIDHSGEVFFSGEVAFSRAVELQSEFDIHIHSSLPGGGLATTLLQAMYLGNFIVSTPYEGANEVITDGENGILLKDASFEEIKRGIQEALIRYPKERPIFAKRNQSIISERFSWKTSVQKYFQLLYHRS